MQICSITSFGATSKHSLEHSHEGVRSPAADGPWGQRWCAVWAFLRRNVYHGSWLSNTRTARQRGGRDLQRNRSGWGYWSGFGWPTWISVDEEMQSGRYHPNKGAFHRA